MKAADGKIAERYTGVYAKWAQSPFLHESPLICGLIEELSAAEERERVLREALFLAMKDWANATSPVRVSESAIRRNIERYIALATPAPEPVKEQQP